MENLSKQILIALLSRNGQTVPGLERRVGDSRSRIRTRLERLEAMGLVRRQQWRKRNVAWFLTDSGRSRSDTNSQGTKSESTKSEESSDQGDMKTEAALDAAAEAAAELAKAEAEAAATDAKARLNATCPVPTPEGYILHPVFNKLARYMMGGIRSIWLTGEAGTGKTTAAQVIAEGMGAELYLATPVQDKYELCGYKGIDGELVETEVYRWATHDGPAILLLDEVDGNLPAALLALNSMLANFVGVFPNGKVKIADDKLVIATANTYGDGPTMKYTARQPLDAAFIDRFEIRLHWGIDKATELAVAEGKTPGCKATVDLSWKIRTNLEKYGIDCEWGPRRTFAMAKAVSLGETPRDAAIDAGLVKLDSHDLENALRGIA